MARRKRTTLPRPGTWAASLAAIGLIYAGWIWLIENPQHSPWAPLDLRDERGWATAAKLEMAREGVATCRAVLERSEVAFTVLEPSGEGECRREDRITLADMPLSPRQPQLTCAVAAGLELWVRQDLTQLARNMLGSPIARIEQLGTYNCRRIAGSSLGSWSQHATGNAIDISAFVLEDGRRISLIDDWDSDGDDAAFLRAARDAACRSFGTVLSPDYNAAHADHFHLDQGRPALMGACR